MIKDAVAEQINTFVSNGTIITIDENKTKKQPITVYGQPQSGCIKICSESLTKEPIEFKSIDDTASPLAQELFKFSYVKEVLSMKTIFQLQI
jgi:hypothetical protein